MVDIHGIGQLYLRVPRQEGAAPSSASTRPCGSEAGQRAFYHRAKLNSAAATGLYAPEMERETANV